MLKIVIFTAKDYTFLFNAWCSFIEKAKPKYEIVGIFVFPDVLKGWRGARKYLEILKILGPFDFMRSVARTLYYEWTHKNKKYFDFRDLGKKNNIPVFYKNDPNESEIVEWVRENNTEVILITFGYILKKPLIESVRVCVLNKHSALLPAFRGLWPVFWAMAGKQDIGVTIHKVGIGIDNGEMVLQKKYPIEAAQNVFDWYDIIYKDMPGMFLDALYNIESADRPHIESSGKPSYFSLPTRKEYKEFRNKGLKFI